MHPFNAGRSPILTALSIGLALLVSNARAGTAAVYESRNDHYRTGANLNETLLNTATVNYGNFGLLFTLPLDNHSDTQILYAPGVSIKGAAHNVIYATTALGSVYAFDADQAGAPLWHAKLGPITAAINSTPIIDPASGILYVVVRTGTYKTGFQFTLHALDITSGAEKLGGPVKINAAHSANGYTVNIANQSLQQHAGLALSQGNLLIGFGSIASGNGTEGSNIDYNGWILSYNAKTLTQNAAFATTVIPPAVGAGVWQSGRAPVIDDQGYAYYFTGNSYTFSNFTLSSNGYDGVNNFSESLLKLNPANLELTDWFTVGKWQYLDDHDLDLSSSGPLLIPGADYIVGGGKTGQLYMWNINNLGKWQANDSQVPQIIPPLSKKIFSIFGGPVFWQRSAAQGGSLLFLAYVGGNGLQSSPVYSYAFNGNGFNPTPVTNSPAADTLNADGHQTDIALSANGDTPGSGVIWAFITDFTTKNSVLRAYDAQNLGNELWNSATYLSDNLNSKTNKNPPTVANGKVYVALDASELAVYGLFAHSTPELALISNQNTQIGSQVNLPVQIIQAAGGVSKFSAANLPIGLSINPTTGVISGTPTKNGSYQTVVSVSVNGGSVRSIGFSWTIHA